MSDLPFHVGSFEVPTFRLARLTLDLGKIFDEYGEDIITSPTTNEMLAHTVLGYKGSESGQYHEEQTSLNTYQLLEGYKHVRISKLGLSIHSILREQSREPNRLSDCSTQHSIMGSTVQPVWVEGTCSTTERCQRMVGGYCGMTGSEKDMKFDQIVRAYDDDTSPIRTIGRTVVIEVTAGKRHYIQPFSEHGRDRTIKWLKKVNIKKTPSSAILR